MIGDRLAVGFLTLNQETEVRTLLPELKAIKHSGAVAVGRATEPAERLARIKGEGGRES